MTTPMGLLRQLSSKLLGSLKIGAKLNIGFGILVALTLAVIGLSYLSSDRAAGNMTRTSELRAPTALAAARAQANLLKMLADVRAYLALGDQEYRAGYEEAKQAFETNLAHLESHLQPGIMAYDSRLLDIKRSFVQWSELPEQLFDLHDDQLAREPALRLLIKDANPQIARVLVGIKGMMTTQERRQPSFENMELLAEMADFQTSFFAMVAGLRGYVTTGRENFKFEYTSNLAINSSAAQKLLQRESLLTRSQQSKLNKMLAARETFLPLPERMFQAVEGERAREDLFLFRTKAVPATETMLSRLQEVTVGEQDLLQSELDEAAKRLATVQTQILMAGVAALLLGIGLAFILRRNIVGPIRRLTGVAEQIGSGDLQTRAAVESVDEIGILARTFNQMTGRLRQTLDDLQQRRNELQTAAGVLRRQNQYLAALHDTTLGLISRLELNDLLEALIARAGELLNTPHGYIYLADEADAELQRSIGVGLFNQSIGFSLQRGEGVSGRVWASGESLVVNDYHRWEGRTASQYDIPIGAILGVPLKSGAKVAGVLGMAYTLDSQQTFADEEIELLERFAQLAAVALDNARLFQETQQAKETAEAVNAELSKALNELKATQVQLVEAEKMAALGGLVAGVAHEINTPVGIGVTAASLLENKTSAFRELYQGGKMKRTDLERYLETADESSRMILTNLSRAAGLIQSFKQVAVDQSSEERRRFAVKPYLEEILLSLRPRLKRTRLSVVINGDEELSLNSYPGDFSQIVTNLVINSLIHAYEPNQQGQLTFELKQERGRLIFVYADDGHGIPEEHLRKIFDPFFTTKRGQGGSGLGMHIIYNLVTQKLGGSIHCESELGRGTRFMIELPMGLDS